MSYTKDTSKYVQSLIWARDTNSGNPAYRELTAFRKQTKLVNTRTGETLPKHKEVIKARGNATTPLTAVSASFRGTRHLDCKVVADQNGEFTQEARGHLLSYAMSEPFYSGAWTSSANSRASERALAAVRELAVSMSGPTFIGELRETVRMLKKPAAAFWDGMQQYVVDLRKRNAENRKRYFGKKPRKYARNLSDIAAGLWLEKSFGWDPFLADIQAAQETYSDLVGFDRVKAFSVGGKDGKLVDSSDGYLYVPPPGSYLIYKISMTDEETERVRYRGAVRMQAETTALDHLARFGFTPSEFVPTAWELLPWSFLADYLANIGSIVSAAVTDTSNVIWLSKSTHKTVDRKIRAHWAETEIRNALGIQNIRTSYGSPGAFHWRKTSLGRSAVGGIDFPTFYWKFRPSPVQLGNVAALLQTVGMNLHSQRPSKRNYRL